ncbi:DNA polymerase III subunit delta [Sulfurimonas sp. MAG313]|nr:DNA polymerase III subunit delta [Sulfurimonas sp. MAG313]
MKKQDFERLLQQAKIPRAMMFFGESDFMIDYHAKKLCDVWGAQDDIFALYHQEYNFTDAKAHISQGSLFGGNNVLLIKSEKKVPKKELDELIKYVQKSPSNFLIYCYYGSDYKTSNKAFSPKVGSDSIRFFNPYFNEAKNIIRNEARVLNLQINEDAITHLLLSQNSNLSLACNELEKLSILNAPIHAKEINEHVFPLAEVKLDEMILAILEKKDFRSNLQRLLETGENEVQIITALSNFITQLFLFHTYIKIHGVISSAAVLGYKLPAFIEKERADLSIRFKLCTYEKLLEHLLGTELSLKSGGSKDNNAILLASLLKLQNLL